MAKAPEVYVGALRDYVNESRAIAATHKSGFRETKNDPVCSVIGMCRKCKVNGTLVFPPGMSAQSISKIGNAILAGKAPTAVTFCYQCKTLTEFVPIGMRKSGVDLIERTQKDLLEYGFAE